jgi:hypothetical protein
MALEIRYIKPASESLRGPVFPKREQRNTYASELGEENFKKMVQVSKEVNTPIPPDTPSLIPTEEAPIERPPPCDPKAGRPPAS